MCCTTTRASIAPSRHASARAARLAAFLYSLYSLALMGVAAPCESVQAAATIWAFVWIAGSDGDRRAALLGGLMIGCAVTLKQTAAFEGAGLFGWMAWRAWRRREGRALAVFVAAGAAPTVAFALYFAAAGHLAEAYTDTVLLAYRRSQLWLNLKPVAGYLEIPRRLFVLAGVQSPIIVLTIAALMAAMRRRRLAKALNQPLALNLGLVWYGSALAGQMVNREPAVQYVMTLIAPGLLLACLLLCEGMAFPARHRRLWMSVFGLVVAAQPLVGLPRILMAERAAPDYRGAVLASAALKADGVRPGDNVLVLSRGDYIYVMTRTLPQVRYFNAIHLLCDFPTPDSDPVAADFKLRPQYVALSDPDMAIACGRTSRMRRIQSWLARDYSVMTTVHGDWDSFILYRRKTP